GFFLGMIGSQLPGNIYLGLEATAYYAAILALPLTAAGLVAIFAPLAHFVRGRETMTGWAVFRNGGMYALMGLAGAYVYAYTGGQVPLTGLSLASLIALALALIAVRLVNELAIFGSHAVNR